MLRDQTELHHEASYNKQDGDDVGDTQGDVGHASYAVDSCRLEVSLLYMTGHAV
jgi:hypothetical protein